MSFAVSLTRTLACLSVGAVLTASASSQIIPRFSYGDAWRTLRGPSLSFQVLKAEDGANETRFVLDHRTNNARCRYVRTRHGYRHLLSATYNDASLGEFKVTAEVDVRPQRGWPISWDVQAKAKISRSDLACSRLGLEVTHADRRGKQSWLVPVFSGGEFEEPFDSIPKDSPVDTGIGNSMQVTAYYSEDGSGLMMYALDPRGTTPKRFVYTSGDTGGSRPVGTVRANMDYDLPNANVGGGDAAFLAPIRICLYAYSPRKMTGWYPAAKYYRYWLECHARRGDGILSKGRLETRTDVPKWMKEMDLLISEQFGWFPDLAVVPNPLFNMARIKADLGAENVMIGFFFWWDRLSPLGLAGSYYPLPATVSQVKVLNSFNIRSLGYTNPGVFDFRNPFYTQKGISTELVQTRSGAPLAVGPEFSVDLTSKIIHDHWRELGAFHSSVNGMSGFFCDAPAQSGIGDWNRPTGQDEGTTESNYLGYKTIVRNNQLGARDKGKDFVCSHEAAFEWLIPEASFGQGPVGVIGRAYRDEDRTRGVPFFQTVYSGYTSFWPAEEGLGWQTIIFTPEPYGDLTKVAISRLLAEGVTWGGLPNHSEIFINQGLIYSELPVPPELRAAFLHHGKTQRNLIAMRRAARPWLVYGELINNPVVDGDMTDVIVKRPFDGVFFDQTFKKFAVPTQAWRAKDRSVRIISANGGLTASKVRIDLNRIGYWGYNAVKDTQTSEVFSADPRTRLITVTVEAATGRILQPLRLRNSKRDDD